MQEVTRATVQGISDVLSQISGFGSGTKLRAAGFNFHVIGHGADKTVVDLEDGRVLKVQRKVNCASGDQVLSEIEVWLKAWGDDRKYLAPILEYDPDGMWNIMPLLKFVGQCPPIKTTFLVQWARRAFGISDIGSSNIGKHDNNWVILDYGIGM